MITIPPSEALLLLVLLVNFAVLAASRLTFTIRITGFQGVLLGLLPLALFHPWTGHHVLLAVGTLVVKGIVLPNVLLWAMREAAVRREVEPTLGPLSSVAAGVVALGLALALGNRLPFDAAAPRLLIAASLTTVMTGLLVLTTRRKAMTQVVGYLLLENGVYLFGLILAARVPLLVESGVLLDLLVGVFIMGLVLFDMNRELESLDSTRLSELTEP